MIGEKQNSFDFKHLYRIVQSYCVLSSLPRSRTEVHLDRGVDVEEIDPTLSPLKTFLSLLFIKSKTPVDELRRWTSRFRRYLLYI